MLKPVVISPDKQAVARDYLEVTAVFFFLLIPLVTFKSPYATFWPVN
jgi:hypothetical protein